MSLWKLCVVLAFGSCLLQGRMNRLWPLPLGLYPTQGLTLQNGDTIYRNWDTFIEDHTKKWSARCSFPSRIHPYAGKPSCIQPVAAVRSNHTVATRRHFQPNPGARICVQSGLQVWSWCSQIKNTFWTFLCTGFCAAFRCFPLNFQG